MDWNAWLAAVEPTLRSGREVIVPPELPHPREMGFTHPWIAEPHGQREDWTFSFEDGSRLHVHEFPNGTLIAHIDPHDPSRGPGTALYHWTTESASGRAFLVTTSLWLLFKILAR